jgi:hypothetical protein
LKSSTALQPCRSSFPADQTSGHDPLSSSG